MIRHKAFGLGLTALFAFAMLAAQGASASPLTVPGGSTTYFTGDLDGGAHVITSTAEVKCVTGAFVAKSTEGSTVNELTFTPTYSGCSAFGFASTDFKTNGCTYTLTTPTSTAFTSVTWDPSQIHIICPEKQKLEITPTAFGTSVCTQSFAAQTPSETIDNHIVGKNVASSSPMDITLEITLRGLSYTGTGGACGSSGNNATYSGNMTMRCYNNALHIAGSQIDCTFG